MLRFIEWTANHADVLTLGVEEKCSLLELNANSANNLQLNDSGNNITTNESNSCSFNKICGGVCGLICIITWVGMSEVIPLLQSDYKKPYLLRYCVGSCFTLMIIIWFLLNNCTIYNYTPNFSYHMILSTFGVSILYNLSCYVWYLSLEATIPSINDTLYQSIVCVAYIFSILLLPNYSMTWMKNLGVILCMIGVGLIGFGSKGQSDKNAKNFFYGYFELFISIFGFGLLEVCIAIIGNKYYSNDDQTKLEKINSKFLMESLMGITWCLTFWIGIPILNWTKIEVFELPKNNTDILSLIIPSLMDTIYAAAFFVGITLTDPVFMACCQLFVIPVSFLWDILFNDLTISIMPIFGIFAIIIGFLMMELPIKRYIDQIRRKHIQFIL